MTSRFWRWIAAAVLLGWPGSGAQATVVDLTSTTSGTLNGAVFIEFASINGHGAGSGNIDAFVRFQDSSKAVTQGYNVDVASQMDFQFDEKWGTFTHSLLLSDVPTVYYEGAFYREFVLDTNEAIGSGSVLSLDAVQIFLADAGNLLDYPTFPAGATTLIYDMDAGDVTNNVWVDDMGSGTLDMLMLVPDSLFSNLNAALNHVVLYSRVGGEGGMLANSDGYEEWAVNTMGGFIPEPGTFSLVAFGLVSLVVARRRVG